LEETQVLVDLCTHTLDHTSSSSQLTMHGLFAFVASALVLSSVVSAQNRTPVKIQSEAIQDVAFCIRTSSNEPEAVLIAKPCTDPLTTFFLYDTSDSRKLWGPVGTNLFVTASDSESDSPLTLDFNDHDSDQLWTIVNAGGQNRIQSQTQCATFSGAANPIILRGCDGGPNQSWSIIRSQ